MFFVKVSIALLYLRLFRNAMSRLSRLSLYAFMALCSAFYLVAVIVQSVTEIKCSNVFDALGSRFCLGDPNKFSVASGVFNTVTDIYLEIMPIPIIMELQMLLRRRLGVIATLSAGGL